MQQSSLFDPVVGVDTHIVLVPTPPGAPVPTPVPMPFVGVVFDPIGLAIGTAINAALSGNLGLVLVNSVPATNCGTDATNKLTSPHLPAPGVSFAKGIPGNDALLYFGSKDVSLGGTLGVRMGDTALSCSDPVRLPSSAVVAIAKGDPVLNNPSMVPDLQAIATALLLKGALKALKKVLKAGARVFRAVRRVMKRNSWCRAVGNALHAAVERIAPKRLRMRLHKMVCTVTGHPVDVATGRLFTDAIDFELTGPLPLVLERTYDSSASDRAGALGYGWTHSLEREVWTEPGKVVYRTGDGREVEFLVHDLPGRRARAGDRVYEPLSKLTLRCLTGGRWEVETTEGIVYELASVRSLAEGRAVLVRIRSRDGHDIELHRDERGRCDRIRDSAGRVVELEHDTKGRLAAVKLPTPRERGWYVHRRYVYDLHGDLVEVVDSRGHRWTFEYQGHLMVRETDRTGLSFRFQYDGVGAGARCVRTWGDGGIYDHVIDYDARNRKTYVENSLGHTTAYEMDTLGHVVAITDAFGGVTRYAYDERTGERCKHVDPLGRETAIEHDERGRMVRVVRPDGRSTTFENDERGLAVAAIDAAGGRWTWRHDHLGRMVERHSPTGETTRLDWKDGLLASIELPGGRRTTFEYDQHKQVRRSIGPDGSECTTWHDGLGRIVKVRDPRGSVLRWEHDSEGNVERITTLTGTVREHVFDAEGLPVEERRGPQHERMEYAFLGRLAARSEGADTVRYEYDTEGQLTAFANEAGERHRWEWDALGNVSREVGFDGRTWSFSRDAAGQVVEMRLPDGKSRRVRHDVLGRPTRIDHADGAFAELAYDAHGGIARAANQSAEVLLEQDAMGRTVRERIGEHVVETTFAPDGTVLRTATSLGAERVVERDLRGGAARVWLGGGAGWNAVDLAHDERGHVIGISSAASGVALGWVRDESGRPVERRITRRGADGAVTELDTQRYRWGSHDRITSIVDAMQGPTTYEHDARGRLVGARGPSGATARILDAVGNVYRDPAKRDRLYGKGGQLLESDGATWRYDADGQPVEHVAADGARTVYRWDAAGTLREVERPDGIRIAFEYDALGRRIRKRVLRPGADGSCSVESETTFVWDGHVVVHEISSENGLTTWHWLPESWTPIARESHGRHWTVCSDHQGTPTELYDEAGRLAWKMQLDAFGVGRCDVGESTDCPWRWPGQYHDAETGLHYNCHRYYDPRSGRYLSPDPIGLEGGSALYGYVEDPTNESDPLGLDKKLGDLGEDYAVRHLRGKGYKILGPLQNSSGHGVDLVVLNPQGQLEVIEVKVNSSQLNADQAKGADWFARDRAQRALDPYGMNKPSWSSMPATKPGYKSPDELAEMILAHKGKIQGRVLYVTATGKKKPKFRMRKNVPWC